MPEIGFRNDLTDGPTYTEPPTEHAYPADLARLVHQYWEDLSHGGDESTEEPEEQTEPSVEPPTEQLLRTLLSTCYQASLLREEERPVAFRVIFAPPSQFPENGGPPHGLRRIEFEEARPFDERDLRRLSPAADFERSLIGVYCDEDGALKIWGIVHAGSRWLQYVQSGKSLSTPLPPVPVVKVEEPGRLLVKRGATFLAGLSGGRIIGLPSDVFSSRWIAQRFTSIREELLASHHEARSAAATFGESWAPLDPDLPRMVVQRMIRRLISIVREMRHGATIIVAPPEVEETPALEHVSLKHTFADTSSRRHFGELIVRVMNRVAQMHGKGGGDYYPRTVGWDEYVQSDDPELAALDEAIAEFAHLMADLASVDGAVTVNQHFELLETV